MAAKYDISDSDGHVYESDADLLEFLDPPYRGKEELLRHPLFPTGDGWHRTGVAMTEGSSSWVKGKITAKKWIDFLDQVGIESTVLYPTCGLGIGAVASQKWAVLLARAYNNWLHEKILKESPRLKGIAILPLQSPSDAVEELKRAVNQLGMVGAYLPGGGLKRLLGDPFYYPVYQTAEELGVILSVHTGVPQKGLLQDLDLFDHLTGMRCLLHPVGQMTQMTHLMFNGVFDRFPNLRMAFPEAGSAWVLCLYERLQREYKHWGELISGLRREPKEHLRSGRLFFEAELDDELLPIFVEKLGNRGLTFASDFPHFTSPEHTAAGIKSFQERSDLSDETKARILGENIRGFCKREPSSLKA